MVSAVDAVTGSLVEAHMFTKQPDGSTLTPLLANVSDPPRDTLEIVTLVFLRAGSTNKARFDPLVTNAAVVKLSVEDVVVISTLATTDGSGTRLLAFAQLVRRGSGRHA